jgi:restriction endonuclease S subunit
LKASATIDEIASSSRWSTTIGQLCDQFGGDVQTGPFGSQLHASDYVQEGTPVVMPQDMVNGRITSEKIARVGPRHVRELQRHALRPGDIVYSRRGDVGRFAVVTKAEEGWLCGTGSIRIRLNSPKILVDYVRYYLQQEAIASWLRRHAKGITMPNLNTDVIRALPFIYPPLEEQRRIADVLDRAEALRAKRRAALAQLDTLTQAIFLDMFGDPATNPKQWPKVSLGEHTSKIGSGATPLGGDSSYKQSGISLIRSMNVRDGYFLRDGLAFIDDAQASKLDGVTVQRGDVLLNITGASVARVCRAPNDVLPARVNQHVSIIRPDETINAVYLEQLLLSSPIKQRLLRIASSGATRQAITKNELEDFVIMRPPEAAQRQFADIAAQVGRLRNKQNAAQDESDTLFASIQHRAFRGEV